jgi:hypothetical protein
MDKGGRLTLILIMLIIIAAALKSGELAHNQRPQLAIVGTDFGEMAAAAVSPAAPPATRRLIRISQLDPTQYISAAQYNAWNNADCAAGALTMVLDAYGQHLIIGQVIPLFGPYISTDGGLLNDQGLAYAAARAHFGASLSHNRTLDQVIAIANSGLPVIVDVRSADLFPAGHFMVVLGGDAYTLHLAESSSANIRWMTRNRFAAMWEGLSAVIAPPNVLTGKQI